MKIKIIIFASLALALLILGKLYLIKTEKLAVEQARTKGLIASYEILNQKYMRDQQRIIERDQEYQSLARDNRRLQNDLAKRIKQDPISQKWAAAAVPGPVRDFVQHSQRRAAGMSGAAGQPAATDPDPQRGSGKK